MNYRKTIQRDLVLEAVQQLNHPTADDVYLAVTAKHPTISRGTVYRNLGLLVTQGVLRKVELAGGADHYDITLQNHYHITCRGCGNVIDAQLPYQAGLERTIGDTQGYVVDEHDISLRGFCPACMAEIEAKQGLMS